MWGRFVMAPNLSDSIAQRQRHRSVVARLNHDTTRFALGRLQKHKICLTPRETSLRTYPVGCLRCEMSNHGKFHDPAGVLVLC